MYLEALRALNLNFTIFILKSVTTKSLYIYLSTLTLSPPFFKAAELSLSLVMPVCADRPKEKRAIQPETPKRDGRVK